MTSTSAPVAESTRSPVGSQPPRRRVLVAVAAVLAAWLIPLLTHLLGLDALLLLAALVGTAGLLRSGRGPVPRLILAAALLYCATCLFGLLFSVWPWHLAPPAVAGFGFTLLIGGYLLSGRRFEFPLRPAASDVPVLAGTVLAAAVALWPLVRRDLAGRLGLFMHVEDFSRHLMIYDTIRNVGGYLFLHKGAAHGYTGSPGYDAYPQGAHFVMAVGENFLRSRTTPGNAMVWASDFIWWHTAAYIAMCLAALWGLGHVAGTGPRAWVRVPVLALATAYLTLGDPITVFDRGYPQELTALTLVAVLVAVLVRPLPRTREQVVLVGALLVGVSFSYYLFLPVPAVLAVAWLFVYRRRLLRVWRFTLVVAVISVAGMAVVPVANAAAAPPGQVLLYGGQATPLDRGLLTALLLLAAAGLFAMAATRRPVGALGLVGLALATVYFLGVRQYQQAQHGSEYFGIKVMHLAAIVAVVLLGALVHFGRARSTWAAAGAGRGGTGGGRRLVAALAPTRLAALLAVVALVTVPFAIVGGNRPSRTSAGRLYLSGGTAEKRAASANAIRFYQAQQGSGGRTTVLLMDGPWPQFLSSVYLSVFQHNYGQAYKFVYGIRPWGPDYSTAKVKLLMNETPYPLTIYTDDPAVAAELDQAAAKLSPGRDVVVVLGRNPR